MKLLVLLYLPALLVTLVHKRAGAVFFGFAIAAHVVAVVHRCMVTGWAPVTNIYETLIWVGLISSILSLVLYARYCQRVIIVAGSVLAIAMTVLAEAIPAKYGAEIRTLPPVLRSNYWLTLHVLTIVSSYGAFAVAMVMGNVLLWKFARRGEIEPILPLLERAIQAGIVLIAAGTVLGGMWADVSWGRFWGWDPKEVWALIILLTYLGLLHARRARWLECFGLAMGAVLAWTTVIMSWYGVNFILGTGLHSYGFGSGGQMYVGGYLFLQWIYVAVIWLICRRNNKLAAWQKLEQLTTSN